MTKSGKIGKLFLIPVPLADGAVQTLSPESVEKAKMLSHFIVEDAKTARRFLKSILHPTPLQEIQIELLNEHSNEEDISNLLKPLMNGIDVGLMSDAGCPAIADPGSVLIDRCHNLKIEVKAFNGPSSILLCLMQSGMNGQQFSFNGYLPRDKNELQKKLKELELLIKKNNQTQLFIETPYRNVQLLSTLVQTLDGKLKLCVAQNLTAENEKVTVCSVNDWKNKLNLLERAPCTFALGQ